MHALVLAVSVHGTVGTLLCSQDYGQGRWHPAPPAFAPQCRSVPTEQWEKTETDTQKQKRQTTCSAALSACLVWSGVVWPALPACEVSFLAAHGTGHWTTSPARGRPGPVSQSVPQVPSPQSLDLPVLKRQTQHTLVSSWTSCAYFRLWQQPPGSPTHSHSVFPSVADSRLLFPTCPPTQ